MHTHRCICIDTYGNSYVFILNVLLDFIIYIESVKRHYHCLLQAMERAYLTKNRRVIGSNASLGCSLIQTKKKLYINSHEAS